jgi:hypothetical protein
MRKGLKFLELVKANNIYKIYQQDKGIEKVKVEYYAVYLDNEDNSLEFYPICNLEFTEGYLIEEKESNLIGIVDLSDNWNLLSDEEMNLENINYLIQNYKKRKSVK